MKIRQAKKIIKLYRQLEPNYWNKFKRSCISNNPRLECAYRKVSKHRMNYLRANPLRSELQKIIVCAAKYQAACLSLLRQQGTTTKAWHKFRF